ncbi:winged helix DNA-binding protein [Paracoccus sp. N5]|uniref:MarR family winged helix-turn-helix transcriptional regulator n=1 Tax=Paracoccus sp. N5 TaxID=1101189 RepID=UPI000371BA6A|nr:winged helix DNA-binding protein [Paracoccus sp. N5]
MAAEPATRPIPQNPLATRLGTLIVQAGRRWRLRIDQRLEGFEVSSAGLAPLVQLARSERPMRQKDLAATLALDASSLVRVLANLETSGLVVSAPDPQDGRAKALSLTPRGRDLALRIAAVSQELEQEVLAGIDADQIAVARAVLQQIWDRLAPETDKGTTK